MTETLDEILEVNTMQSAYAGPGGKYTVGTWKMF